ncbi:MAG: Type 4 prepilin-like protein leader peptide-processing enzyme [Candidatus Moranbacteria bacterium GW2011_GWA2_39_41]|nr:MAG: Type 4 prepilin-like protein leader peptide-processing enzyme [Candidatus Moranbacteria bacterium GW2011_GWA2_39_41]
MQYNCDSTGQDSMIILIFFVFGLIVGSFLNVVVYRLNVAESFVTGRSHCTHCKTNIAWYDNIPVISFILLKFRCRNCKEKISWQYPLVEIFTGLLFALIGYKFFDATVVATWVSAIYYLGIVSFLLVIFVYDFLYMEIPGLALWPAMGYVIVFNLFFDWVGLKGGIGGQGGVGILDGLVYAGTLGAVVAFAFFFAMVAISKEKWMGMGDAYLVILLGLILGWPNILLALMLAFSLGAIFGVVLILAKQKKMSSQIPFAPFLVLGTLITMLWYDQIVDWYMRLFV